MTLANAVKQGFNHGTLGVSQSEEVVFLDWRLYGDVIEARLHGQRYNPFKDTSWKVLSADDYAHEFSNGVFGQNIDWSMPQEMLEYLPFKD